MAKKIPITLLTGYLGAGKTTLLNHILHNQKGYKVAVVVNDIGEVNIDADMIAKGGALTSTDSIVPLTNGCICCSLKSDMVNQIEGLVKTGNFDYVLIEASGICEPIPIAQALMTIRQGRLDGVVAVVDAKRLVDEFASGDALLGRDSDEEDIEGLLIQQIEFCSTLIINKIDLASEADIAKIRKIVAALNPKVKVIEAKMGEVELGEVFDTGRFDFEKVYENAGWVGVLDAFDAGRDKKDDEGHHDEHEHEHEHHHDDGHSHTEEFGISSFVYCRRAAFDQQKLDEFASRWPKSVVRTKGIVWLADEPNACFVLEQSGRQISLGVSGPWLAVCSKREQQKYLAEDEALRKNWDEKFGDRMIKLVVIGVNMSRKAVEDALDSLLVHPEV